MSLLQDSAISFTNKDFLDLYPELMTQAALLSAKWDPTVSNETDPGVVFIKELALMGDKINYNADKNALENYPESVTLISTSKSIFNIVGYYPHWYRSSKISVRFSWIGDDIGTKHEDSLTIPIFTSLTNADNTKIYTTIESGIINGDVGYTVVPAIEGTLTTASVNNSSTITISMLDSNNRLYLDDYAVAENGIFISNYDSDGKPIEDFWQKVDNLSTIELSENSKYFELGIDIPTSSCYIQFPDNISALIGQGLCVRYIITSGSEGNISIGDLDTIYESPTGVQLIGGESSEVSLSLNNISLSNVDLISSGQDYETINEAWAACKHTLGTFESLITCRDYANALYNCDINTDNIAVSNDYVCDRTNDILDAYSTVVYDPYINVEYIKQNLDKSSSMTPYNLKIYALLYPSSGFTTKLGYTLSFSPFIAIDPNKESTDLQKLVLVLDNRKSICHDYMALENNRISFLTNLYLLNCQIIPSQTLTEKQLKNIKDAICKALYKSFNSRVIDFGEAPSLESLVNTIEGSDLLIKYASVDSFTYETHAKYYGADLTSGSLLDWTFNNKLISYPLTSSTTKEINFTCNSIEYKSIIISLNNNNLDSIKYVKTLDGSEECVYENNQWTENKYKTIHIVNDFNFTNANNFNVWLSTNALSTTNIWHDIIISDEYSNGYTYGEGLPSSFTPSKNHLDISTDYIYTYTDTSYLYSALRPLFRSEIVAKSMLKGNTPVFKYDESDFDYALNQSGIRTENITSIKSNKNLIFDLRGTSASSSLVLKDNEYLQFRRPKTDIVADIGVGIRYLYVYTGGGTITINTDEIHELGDNESLYLFNKPSTDAQYYICYKYTKGAIILPTFSITSVTEASLNLFGLSQGKVEDNYRLVANTYDVNNIAIIESINTILTSTKTISVLKIASVELNKTKGYKWYSITNKTVNSNNKELFVLTFYKDTSYQGGSNLFSAQLGEGEYFCYTDKELQILNIYGAGTLIQFYSTEISDSISWTCPVTSISYINSQGISALTDYWQETTTTFSLTEQEFINISPKEEIIFVRKDDSGKYLVTISSKGIEYKDSTGAIVTTPSLNLFNIQYKLIGETVPTSLPSYSTQSNEWKARTYLNINCSPDVTLILSDATLSITLKGNSEETTITGDLNNPLYLQCSQYITLDGPSDFYSLATEDLITGEPINWIFYYYKINNTDLSMSDTGFTNGIISEGTKVVYDGATLTITINEIGDGLLKIGDYLLPSSGDALYILQAYLSKNKGLQDNDSFYISTSNIDVYDPSTAWKDALTNQDALVATKATKAVFYNVPLSWTSATVLAYLHYHKESSGSLVITIPAVRYGTKNSLATNLVTNFILNLNYNSEFNLFHYVDSNEIISNPLKSDSFLNSNHPYNKYTLCQIDSITTLYKQ